jgi:signal transduction histidine kinase
VALPRKSHDARSSFDRSGRSGVIVQHPAAESRADTVEARAGHDGVSSIGVLESRLRDEARLEGVRLAAREMAHLLNNDLAIAVGCVDLLQSQTDLPSELLDLLHGVSRSLDAAARHVEQLQRVERIVVKETPAGASLDLERSRSRQ